MQKNYDEALANHQKAIMIRQKLDKNDNAIAASLLNIGSVYTNMGKFEEAM